MVKEVTDGVSVKERRSTVIHFSSPSFLYLSYRVYTTTNINDSDQDDDNNSTRALDCFFCFFFKTYNNNNNNSKDRARGSNENGEVQEKMGGKAREKGGG